MRRAWPLPITLLVSAAACEDEAAHPVADAADAASEAGPADVEIEVHGADVPPIDAAPAPDVVVADPLASCRGTAVPLRLARDLPYADVRIGDDVGAFLVDWGTTGSALDPSGFAPDAPAPAPGTTSQWDGFDYFGPWARVTLSIQDFSAFAEPVRQAGILGTDFLSLNTFVVDWRARTLARAEPGAGCSAATLEGAGLVPLSTAGHFARDLDALLPGVPNVPAVRVRIGLAEVRAQIDTGYDDALAGPAMNVNRAFFDTVDPGLVARAAERDLVLTTCVPGVVEPVAAWRLAAGAALELVAADGAAARRHPDALLFVKDTPPEAARCGGIGTWTTPGAQLGVSFMARAGLVVFDPEAGRVWLPRER
ncbi:MAG: hypothetical protein IT385_25215 [Deltaproteobacteria bacterium]|nr:hypothetical protein [Deltaproteobacteria bacterium]